MPKSALNVIKDCIPDSYRSGVDPKAIVKALVKARILKNELPQALAEFLASVDRDDNQEIKAWLEEESDHNIVARLLAVLEYGEESGADDDEEDDD